MKYGAMNFPVKPVLDEVEKIAGLGFDYVELTLDPPCAHYSDIDNVADQLTQALARHSLGLVCHLPTFVFTADLALGIRRASVNEMLNSLRTAAKIRAQKVVLHPSIIHGMGPFVMDKSLKYAKKSFETILEEAQGLALPVCFENMFPNYNSFFSPDDFSTLFDEFPGLKMALDTGHANLGDPGGERLFEFIDRFPGRIGHVHASDNNGQRDDHLKLGDGCIDFKKLAHMLNAAGYNDTITFEIFTQKPKDLLESRELMAALLAEI